MKEAVAVDAVFNPFHRGHGRFSANSHKDVVCRVVHPLYSHSLWPDEGAVLARSLTHQERPDATQRVEETRRKTILIRNGVKTGQHRVPTRGMYKPCLINRIHQVPAGPGTLAISILSHIASGPRVKCVR